MAWPGAEEELEIATVVPRALDPVLAISFLDLLNLRRDRLESLLKRILLPVLAAEPVPAFLQDGSSAAVVLPATGAIVIPLSRLRPEFRTDNAEFWVLTRIIVHASAPALPAHLLEINLDPACRDGASQLIGVIDSGVDTTTAEADGVNVSRFAVVDTTAKLTEPATTKDYHNSSSKPPGGGWLHGSQICARCAGQSEGVAPHARLAVVAALTRMDAEKQPIGSLPQFLGALAWLLTSPFRADPNLIGCDVINASLTIVTTTAAQRAAVDRLIEMSSKANILIVCAVGADRNPAGVPLGALAAHESTLAVGALDSFLRFSNLNLYDSVAGKPEICAPGPSTSLAAPLVTGSCALLLGRDPNLRADSQQLKLEVVQNFATRPVLDAPGALDTGRLSLEAVCPEDLSFLRWLHGLPQNELLSLTIECQIKDSPSIEQLSFRSYLAAMEDVLGPLKRPLIEQLQSIDGVGVVDVNHTPFVVATATAAQWREWMGPEGWLVRIPGVVVLPNSTAVGATLDE